MALRVLYANLYTKWLLVSNQHVIAQVVDSPGRVLLGAFVFSLAILVVVTAYNILLHPLSPFPGPLLARISGLWRSTRYWKGTWHDDILEVHKIYGRVVRIAPNELSIVDEHAMKNLYGHGHNADKTSWYSVWDPPNTAPQLFSELDRKNHSFLRKRVAGAYAMSSILKYEQHIQGCLDLLLWKLKDKAELGENVNMADWTNAFAFDVVGELAYGSQLGHLRTETDVSSLRSNIFNIFFTLSNLGHFPGQAWILNNSLTQALMWILRVRPVFAEFAAWSRERVKYRMDNQEKIARDDMLGHFCRMKRKDGSPALLNEVQIEAMNLM